MGLLLAAIFRAVWGFAAPSTDPGDREPSGPNSWETDRAPPTEPLEPPAAAPDVALPPPSVVPRLTIEIRPPAGDEGAPGPERPRRIGPVDPGALRISQRIVLHLARLGRFGPEEVAPPGATQAGMTEALGVRQTTLTKVLARLVAGGALEESRSHVQGAPRRLKVYRLTPLGEAISKDLRRSGRSSGAPTLELPPAR